MLINNTLVANSPLNFIIIVDTNFLSISLFLIYYRSCKPQHVYMNDNNVLPICAHGSTSNNANLFICIPTVREWNCIKIA